MYDYKLRYHYRPKKSFPIKQTIFVIILISALFIAFKLRNTDVFQKKELKVINLPSDIKGPQNITELKIAVNNIIQKKTGTYSVYYVDLNSGENFGLNQEQVMTAASVNKIPILAALYYLANKGDIDLDKEITLQSKDIQDYGTGVIRYQTPPVTYTIRELAQLMMEKSDNTSSYVIASKIVGLQKVQDLVNSWGLTQTNMDENTTSNHDMALLMQKMYKGEIANQELTNEMIGFMDDSDFEERLPKLLPENINVYHKIGNEVNIIHDVGIIDSPGKPYYLGVMTNNIAAQEQEAKDAIAEISKMIFLYRKNRN